MTTQASITPNSVLLASWLFIETSFVQGLLCAGSGLGAGVLLSVSEILVIRDLPSVCVVLCPPNTLEAQ